MIARGETLTEGLGVVTGTELFGVSLSASVLLYVEHLLVLFLVAFVLGSLDRLRGDDDRDRRKPWQYAFNDAGEGQIEVFLENGPHIRGEFDPSAWDSSRKGLYLRNPKSLSDGETVPLGQSMLVRSEWITGVVFPEDDPNSEQIELVEMPEELVKELEAQISKSDSKSERDGQEESDTDDEGSDGNEPSQ